MKFLIIIFLSIIYTQDRSLIFTTGAPLGNCASSTTPCNTDTDCAFGNTCVPPEYHTINSTYSLSNRIYASGNMALEAMKFYAEPTDESSFAKIILQEDNDGIPGEEIHSWDIDVHLESHGNNYFLILTTDLCIYLYEDNYYWLTMHASDEESEINWLYSNNDTFTFTSSSGLDSNWNEPSIGNCGSLSVWAEYIYEAEITEEFLGDLNSDGAVNVLDIVTLTNGILSGNMVPGGDINGDESNNVLDVVALVNIVLHGSNQEQLSDWEYIDINPNSSFYSQLVGPSIFNGNVSVYYFGKAG